MHSTGQLHKVDGGGGLFLQITAYHPRDADIPDEAGSEESSLTFGVLVEAQALGDRHSRRSKDKPGGGDRDPVSGFGEVQR